MGTARSVIFTVFSILMILTGAGGIAEQVLIVLERYGSPGASLGLTFICAACAFIGFILDIISGIGGVRSSSKRINATLVIRLPAIAIILCLLSVILSFFNGIIFGYLLVQFGIGILIPAFFIYTAVKKSHIS